MKTSANPKETPGKGNNPDDGELDFDKLIDQKTRRTPRRRA